MGSNGTGFRCCPFLGAIIFIAQNSYARRTILVVAALLLLIATALALLSATNALFVVFGVLLGGALLLFPELAVYLLVFAIPFGSLMPLPIGGANVTAADGFLVLAWALYLARGVARRRVELRPPPLALPFLFFIFAAALSITVSRSFTDSMAELLKWVEMFAAYWLISQFFDLTRVERLLAVMFLAGLAQALLGAYQYYFRAGPEGFLLFGGANLRAYGTFEQPNPYAGYLGLILPLAFGTALGILTAIVRRGRTPQRPAQGVGNETASARTGRLPQRPAQGVGNEMASARTGRSLQRLHTGNETAFVPYNAAPYHLLLLLLATLSFLVMLAALFFSYSRGAWVGVAAALGITALLALVRSKRAASLAFVLGLTALILVGLGEINLVPNIISERFATVGDYFGFEDVRGVRANDENFAIVERRAHWQAALAMFADSPWLGVGIGNYAVVYPAYALPRWDDPLGHAHNYYLNVLAEAGGIGFIAYSILWGAIFWIAGRAVLRAQGWTQGVVAGAFGVLVALSIHNFFDNLFVHAMYIQVGMTLGIVSVLEQRAWGEGSEPSSNPTT